MHTAVKAGGVDADRNSSVLRQDVSVAVDGSVFFS